MWMERAHRTAPQAWDGAAPQPRHRAATAIQASRGTGCALRQTLCHPLVCSKSRSRTIQEDYAFLQRACENRKLSTLRELCNNTIELGKGMYEHERVDLEETIAAVALAEGHADAVVEGGARPAGTQALITLQSALQEIKMGRGFLGAMEKPQTGRIPFK